MWVCREEKLISGLSKRTTCADVMRVLLEEQSFQTSSAAPVSVLTGSPESYCLVEKWRGFERVLPNKTKILRLWSAWGDEQENVRFVLVKQGASLPNSGPRSAEARVVPSKESPCVQRGTARVTMAALSQEKQRRIVRKAFRKLEKINKKRAQALSKDKSAVERMETLVHLIVSQDHTIRQQIQRIQELDREIDQYEAEVHFDRVKTLGTNYVQDTYLFDKSLEAHPSAGGEEQRCPEVRAQLEEYAQRCEEVLKLQEELSQHEMLLDNITTEITDELNVRWMERRKEQLSRTGSEAGIGDRSEECELALETDQGSRENSLLLEEEERVKTQLDTSLYIGLRLHTDLEAIRSDLDLSSELWVAKERELTDLLDRVGALDMGTEDKLEVNPSVTEPGAICSVKTQSQCAWVEQARGLSKTCNGNDDDSDTGLSSLHSQDSDNPPVCESLV